MATYIGAPLKRFEDPALVSGAGTYVDDVHLPGMLHAAVLHSPHAHARIKSIDTTSAASLPGVVAVVTADDLEGTATEIRFMPHIFIKDQSNLNMLPRLHPVLARDRVRYVGEAIAVVVAESMYLARDAVDLIRVDYEPLPVVVDLEEALKGEVILHEDAGTNVLISLDEPDDDLEDAFREAHKIVRGDLVSQRVANAPMENRGIVATYDRSADLLTVWSATQNPHLDKAQLVHILNRDPDGVRVIAPEVGGGFGGKRLRPDMAAVCYLAIKLERPIRCIEDRSGNLTFYHARGATCRFEAAVKEDGTILGLHYRLLWDLGAYYLAGSPVSPIYLSHRMAGPYKTPRMNIQMQALATNKPCTSAFRSAGGAEASYFCERVMDLIAAELDISPVQVREKNLVPPDAFPFFTRTGYKYDSGNYQAALDKTLKMADYDKLRREQKQARAQGRLVGIGVGTFIKSSGGDGALRVGDSRVEIDASGRVSVVTDASPHGQGSDTVFAQITADGLGIKPEDATILHGDTDLLSRGGGSGASRGVLVSGSAVLLAVQQAREKMDLIASDLFQCAPEDVDAQDGYFFPKSAPDSRVPFAEVAARAFSEDTLPQGMTPGLEFTSEFTLAESGFPYGSQVTMVEVDRDTGEVKILRQFAVHDQGNIMNPTLVEGQHQGGIAQGIGQAITEEMAYDSDGQPLASTFMDYGMPVAEDIPRPVLDTTQVPSPTNPLGAKGAGEIATTGTAGVITNAVVDALSEFGVRHIDTPLTAEKVWRIIHRAGS